MTGPHVSVDNKSAPSVDGTAAQLPLTGITVVDLSRALAGPYCSALLADLGARVIKVESGAGDPARQWPPFKDETSLYFDSTNRNKESIWIDLYSDEGRALLVSLLEKADLLLENFKLGTLEKMSFGPQELERINPNLIHVSVNAYGLDGPLKDLPGLDQVIQGASGITSVTGPPDGDGYRVGLPVVDIASGMVAAFTAVSLILGRDRGHGARFGSTSLYETALSMSVFQGQKALSTGVAPERQGNDHPSITPYGSYETATDPLILAVSTERHWASLCEILGRRDLKEDPRFATGNDRSAHREVLNSEIRRELLKEPADHWLPAIRARGIPAGPIRNLAQVMEEEQTLALGMIQTQPRSDGSEVSLLRGPMTINGAPVSVRKPPPLLSEDAGEILSDLGFSPQQIEDLLSSGVVKPGKALS